MQLYVVYTTFSQFIHQFNSVQLLTCVQLFATLWTEACQASLSITNSGACSDSCPLSWWCQPASLILCLPFSCIQSFPASWSFLVNQFCASGGQNIGVSASALVFPMNIQNWYPLGLTGLNSLQSKGLSRVFNTTVRKHQFFELSLLCGLTLTSIYDYWKDYSFD